MSFRFNTGQKKPGKTSLSYASCVNFRPSCRIFFLGLTVLLLAAMPKNAYAACTSPAGVAGEMGYNLTGSGDYEYCDGTNWVSMETGDMSSGSGSPLIIDITTDTAQDGLDYYGNTCSILNDGTAWCSGTGSNGELGNGTNTFQVFSPVQVGTAGTSTLWSDWTDIDGGAKHFCGIRSNGTAWCWGYGGEGQLGNNSTANQNVPVQVGTAGTSTLWSDWTQISASKHHSCGLRSNGTAWCWGSNSAGIGSDQPIPVKVPTQVGTAGNGTLWSDWVDIDVDTYGYGHSCGVRSNGTAWCWGPGSYGRLGNGSTASEKEPVQVGTAGTSTLWSDWTQISAGKYYSCGIRSNGTAWCWGDALYGRLGNDDPINDVSTPVQVGTAGTGTLWSDWTQISAGQFGTCGIRSSGAAYCWGSAYILGIDTTTNAATPVRLGEAVNNTLWSDWSKIDLGSGMGCGIRDGGNTYCWGSGDLGQMGSGDFLTQSFPPVPIYMDFSYSLTATNTVKGGSSPWTGLSGVSLSATDSLLLCIATQGTVSGVTWNGQAMTMDSSNTAVDAHVYIYSIHQPTAGTGDVVATISGTNTSAIGGYIVNELEASPFNAEGNDSETAVNTLTVPVTTTTPLTFLLSCGSLIHASDDDYGAIIFNDYDNILNFVNAGGTSGQGVNSNIVLWMRAASKAPVGTPSMTMNAVNPVNDYSANIAAYDIKMNTLAIGSSTVPCSTAGEMQYDSTNHVVTWCDGSTLKAAGTAGSGGAGCSTPTSIEGAMLYNSSASKMQFCDGASWVTIP